MVAGKGFDGVISALIYSYYASSQAAMCALVEWWMDTTHTFYLPFREMTITPLDFTTITGLSFSREPIPLSSEAYSSVVVRNAWLKDLFRVITFVKSGYSSLIWYIELVAIVRSGYNAVYVSSEQLA